VISDDLGLAKSLTILPDGRLIYTNVLNEVGTYVIE
jgi:hypothetical protein